MTCLVCGETHWGSGPPACRRKRLDHPVSLRPRNRYRLWFPPLTEECDDHVRANDRSQGEIKQPIAQTGGLTFRFQRSRVTVQMRKLLRLERVGVARL